MWLCWVPVAFRRSGGVGASRWAAHGLLRSQHVQWAPGAKGWAPRDGRSLPAHPEAAFFPCSWTCG